MGGNDPETQSWGHEKYRGWNGWGPTLEFHTSGGQTRTAEPAVVFPSDAGTTWEQLIASVKAHERRGARPIIAASESGPDWTPRIVQVLNAVIALSGQTDAVYPIRVSDSGM